MRRWGPSYCQGSGSSGRVRIHSAKDAEPVVCHSPIMLPLASRIRSPRFTGRNHRSFAEARVGRGFSHSVDPMPLTGEPAGPRNPIVTHLTEEEQP